VSVSVGVGVLTAKALRREGCAKYSGFPEEIFRL
jgi:hypothetical protein